MRVMLWIGVLLLPTAVWGAPSSDDASTQDDGASPEAGFGQRILGGPDVQRWLESQPAEPAVLPHRYGKVAVGASRLPRIPTSDEQQAMATAATGKGSWPAVAATRSRGVLLVALEPDDPTAPGLYRTVDGEYLRQADVVIKPAPAMHGELLGPAIQLPLAFVFGEDRPVYRMVAGELTEALMARKHSRFHVERELTHGEQGLVEGPRGMLFERDSVRVARVVRRPSQIPAGAKWIHVALDQQTLVAYEGDRPLLATLVSSGRQGYEPPTGVFRVRWKHVEHTMDGPDPTEGWYEVQRVPWTMYYHRSFALHGAYWHDDFGQVRSHGCTNIAPADARWLFSWTDPALPANRRSLIEDGTHVYFTD